MLCPACKADNPDQATSCGSCGVALASSKKGSRGRGSRPGHALPEGADTPWGKLGEGPDRPARLAYHLAVVGLVPGLGLLLGPTALALGAYAHVRGRADAAFTAEAFSRTAIGLGLAEALTNWAGLVLMVLAWR
jgi:hypothetical protein